MVDILLVKLQSNEVSHKTALLHSLSRGGRTKNGVAWIIDATTTELEDVCSLAEEINAHMEIDESSPWVRWNSLPTTSKVLENHKDVVFLRTPIECIKEWTFHFLTS
jgi:hypothetical protein